MLQFVYIKVNDKDIKGFSVQLLTNIFSCQKYQHLIVIYCIELIYMEICAPILMSWVSIMIFQTNFLGIFMIVKNR